MTLEFADVLTVAAILVAPVAAVQVQKWLESYRQDNAQRLWIFKTLMATRAATVSREHVQALNMIDLEFRGTRYRKVTTAWRTYLDHLSSFPRDNENQQPVWGSRQVDLLTSLLLEMGRALGYEFDEVHMKKGIYAPEAHGQLEHETNLIRRGFLNLLSGNAELKMNVTNFPVGE